MPILKKLNDEQLVLAVRRGDRQALLQLYSDNYVTIKNYIIKNSGRPEDADDILQDACVAVWEKIVNNELELKAKLSTFVFAICRNLWLKKLNRQGKQVNLDDTHTENLADTPDRFNKQDLDLVVKMMDKMGEKCRQILNYFYFEGRDMNDIAELMDYSNADTAKAKKHQCFKQLQELFLNTYSKQDFLGN
ncbi:MAG TPA: RNA polymerase sigma factor [Bacteroidia bacterium]